MSSKLGRKGDPRMHRAVAARMENPNLSLYEALCLGGFEYAENDDKSVLDSKQVTLGQRKNQLSRRLRLARKQKAGALKKPPPGSPASVGSGTTEIQNGTNMLTSGISETQAHAQAHAQKKTPPILSQQKPQHQPLHPTPLNGRTKHDVITELAAGTLMSNNIRNGSNGGPPSKRQRFTCVTKPAANSKLNLNHSLCQGWFLNKMPTDDASNAMLGSGPTLGQGPSMHYPPSGLYYSPPIPANRSVARYQTGPSAVALSSLTASAQTVGLTLEQLALTLSSNTTSLNKLVQEARSGESETKQEQLALDLFQADVKALYTKCLLMAGVDASLAEQSTPTYMKFATKAWEAEGKRLRTIRNAVNSVKEPKQFSITFDESTFYQSNGKHHSQHSNGTPSSRSSKSSKDNHNHNHNHNGSNGARATNLDWTNPVNHSQCSHDNGDHNRDHNHNHKNHNHDHDHDHDHEHTRNGTNGNKGDCNGSEKHQSASYNGSEKHDGNQCDSRHFHHLGECGHKAIIHKPKDGVPHIDFIVNDQIECYQGTDTMSLAGSSLAGRSEKSIDTVWPSKYRCKEVDNGGAGAGKSCGSRAEPAFAGTWNHLEPLQEPKLFKLSDINASDPEWLLDATEEVDEGVMGLFELSRDPSAEVTANI